jgi:serine/threonine protein kinase
MHVGDGDPRAQRHARPERLAAAEIADLALQIAEGLAGAHGQQIVHRDLKPHNVMVTGEGRVKIVDFGLAKPLRPIFQQAGLSTSEMISADLGGNVLIGTCSYMSPEQASGKQVDARSDVFAFGIILYEMVAGRRPFRGDTATEILARILEADPEPLVAASVPAALTRIVWRCLNKDAGDRYGDTRELVADLRRVRDRLSRQTGDRASRLVAAGMLLLLIAPLSYFWIQSRGRGEEGATAAPAPSRRDIALPSPGPAAKGGTPPEPETNTSTNASNRKESDTEGDQKGIEDDAKVDPSIGTLSISSRPRATVLVDGTLVGLTPLTYKVSSGTHEITLTSPEGLRWRGRVEVAGGRTATLDRNLEAAGRLTLTSDVWYRVSLDGGPAEETPIHFPRVAAGLHEVRASREGYVTRQYEVFIEEGETVALKIDLEKSP